MEHHDELFVTIQKNLPQKALYYTGELIKLQQIELLEKTWLFTLSHIANFSQLSFKKFHSIVVNLLTIFEADAFHIAEAFHLTLQLCLIFKDCSQYIMLPKLQIATLRNRVIGFFSDEFKLSEKGLVSFKYLLTSNEQEKEFIIKVITGLIQLWNQKQSIEFRNTLEYIDRKHYEIELPTDVHLKWGSNHYSFTVLIWEVVCILEPIFKPLAQLFKIQYTRKYHYTFSLPFLLVTHTYLQTGYNNDWTDQEITILDKVKIMSDKLYLEIEVEKPIAICKEPLGQTFAFENFFPTTTQKIEGISKVYESIPMESKTILLNKRKFKEKKNKDNKVTYLPYE
uniref:Uncharacterized protein n=1 Tax=viral metagenome TaxID=1070528 RepID=A0A6C0CS94_9ZZZZ